MFLQKETKKRRGKLKLQADYIVVIRKKGVKLGGIAQCKGKSLGGSLVSINKNFFEFVRFSQNN